MTVTFYRGRGVTRSAVKCGRKCGLKISHKTKDFYFDPKEWFPKWKARKKESERESPLLNFRLSFLQFFTIKFSASLSYLYPFLSFCLSLPFSSLSSPYHLWSLLIVHPRFSCLFKNVSAHFPEMGDSPSLTTPSYAMHYTGVYGVLVNWIF